MSAYGTQTQSSGDSRAFLQNPGPSLETVVAGSSDLERPRSTKSSFQL